MCRTKKPKLSVKNAKNKKEKCVNKKVCKKYCLEMHNSAKKLTIYSYLVHSVLKI